MYICSEFMKLPSFTAELIYVNLDVWIHKPQTNHNQVDGTMIALVGEKENG